MFKGLCLQRSYLSTVQWFATYNFKMELLIAAAVVGGFYVCGSVLSVIGTLKPNGYFGAFEAHSFVVNALPTQARAAVLFSELGSTLFLWIGLIFAKNRNAYAMALAGYAALLAWLCGFSFKYVAMAPRTRKAGLVGTWFIFSAAFLAAAGVVSARSKIPNFAVGFVWVHAAHRLVFDGAYTYFMLKM